MLGEARLELNVMLLIRSSKRHLDGGLAGRWNDTDTHSTMPITAALPVCHIADFISGDRY